jgi:hypothetical protein
MRNASPQKSRIFTIDSGDVAISVSPELSGRVTQLLFRGENLLVDRDVHPSNWGATYWTSPQADWGWPPVSAVDGEPFEVVKESSQSVTLLSSPAQIGERQFRIEKTFARGPSAECFDTTYTIKNIGRNSFAMANWEIMRVPAGGLTFFPTGSSELTPIPPHDILPTEKSAGTTFFDHAHFTPGRCQKLHADGQGGYLAHLSGNLLILKMFVDTQPSEQAPGEGECEIFANDDGKYVEVEVQGPYRMIESGAESAFFVRTAVFSLPSSVARRERGALREFADLKARAFS